MGHDVDEHKNKYKQVTGLSTDMELQYAKDKVSQFTGIKKEDVHEYTIVHYAIKMAAVKGIEWYQNKHGNIPYRDVVEAKEMLGRLNNVDPHEISTDTVIETAIRFMLETLNNKTQ